MFANARSGSAARASTDDGARASATRCSRADAPGSPDLIRPVPGPGRIGRESSGCAGECQPEGEVRVMDVAPDVVAGAGDATDLTCAEEIRLRYAAIVESSDDAIIAKTLEGVISAWNPAAVRMFGYTGREAIGQPITMIIPADRREEERELPRRLRAGERIDHYETVRVTKTGERLDVSVTISPLRDLAGTIIGCSKIARDITKAKQAGAALRRSEQRLTREVAGAKALQSISTRLISESTPESLYRSNSPRGRGVDGVRRGLPPNARRRQHVAQPSRVDEFSP